MRTQRGEEVILQRPSGPLPESVGPNLRLEQREPSVSGDPGPAEGCLGTGQGAGTALTRSPKPLSLTKLQDTTLDGVG